MTRTASQILDASTPISHQRRAAFDRGFLAFCLVLTTLAVAILAVLLVAVTASGARWLVNPERMAAFNQAVHVPGPWENSLANTAAGWAAALAVLLCTVLLAPIPARPRRVLNVLLALLAAGGLLGFLVVCRWEFFTEFSSRFAAKSGIHAPLMGSIWVCATSALLALPIGVATAVYLEEFAGNGRFTRFIRLNISNLSGVPSIVYGIIGLTAFVRMFGLLGGRGPDGGVQIGSPDSFFSVHLPLGQSVLAGALTLMLVILPIIIVSSQEALRAVPNSLRQGALAMGATRWQTVWKITLPASVPMIMTGSILAVSRAIGEAAPLLVLGVPLFIRSVPENLMSEFTVLPFQIYKWAADPKEDFRDLAASAIVVLLVVLLSFNAIAVLIRQKLQRSLA